MKKQIHQICRALNLANHDNQPHYLTHERKYKQVPQPFSWSGHPTEGIRPLGKFSPNNFGWKESLITWGVTTSVGWGPLTISHTLAAARGENFLRKTPRGVRFQGLWKSSGVMLEAMLDISSATRVLTVVVVVCRVPCVVQWSLQMYGEGAHDLQTDRPD